MIREVLAETGVEGRPERLIGVYKDMDLGVVTIVFRCRPVGGLERESDESDAVVWLSRAEAEELTPQPRAARWPTPSATMARSSGYPTATS